MAERGDGMTTLAELEELVLLAVMRRESDAYGAVLQRELSEHARRDVSVSTVYVTLIRLEEKGLLTSRRGTPTAARGGKAKRLFETTPEGVEALRATRATRDRMWDGVELPGPVQE